MSRFNWTAAALAAVVAVAPATAAEKVGGAKRIVNEVAGTGAVGARRLAVEDPVYRDERITASPASRGELELDDGSRIIVGENSTVALDRFVVADGGFANGTINIAKGAFRFISGSSPKGSISVRTPLSTIGIRGTIFDVYVGEGGVTRVVLLKGSVTTCSIGGQCLVLSRACDIAEVTGPRSVQRLPFLRSAGRTRAAESSEFDLTERRFRHSPGWRVWEGSCTARAAMEAQEGRRSTGGDPAEFPSPPSPPDDDDCGECG